ncbi:hypothetical protein E4T44_07954 [Aureobasidium sp. EXF-8845]|nr:hypothetical protein E4T44_07954 [Aureobasidium sp. EXF-8845]KAI4846016.1 hypothetical protein E4T45_07446 [Aureobasidium sp. EXF-8846]
MRLSFVPGLGLPLILSGLVAGEKQYGVLGFGIPMYKPLCCYSCHDAMSLHNLCRRHGIWLETLSNCVHEKCSKDGVDESVQAQCFSKLAANGLPVSTFQDSLPSIAPSVELEAEATWLNTTSLVNEHAYLANYITMKEFVSSEHRHTRYALVIMLSIVGICIIAGAWKTYIPSRFKSNSLALKLKQHLLVPAAFNKRHLSPLPYHIGYLPKRALSLFIGAYVVLNIVFSAVSFHHVTPSVWYTDRRHEIAAYVSNRTGVLSFANLALAMLFSGRNNLLINVTGWSQSTMLAIHRWASRVATVQAVVHSILYTLTYMWTGGSAAYKTEAVMAYYWWGIIATVVLCLSVAFAILPIRVRSYEIFLITHIAFAILALMGCWYHIHLRFGDKWGYKVWLYIAFAFWAFDRLMRSARLVYFNCFGSPMAVVKQVPYTDIIQMTITLKRPWNVKPGQHSFLYIPLLGKPWENHPFTIASWSLPESDSNTPAIRDSPIGKEAEVHGLEIDSSSDSQHSHETLQPHQLVCLMRIRKGMTASLLSKLRRSEASSLPISILTEGIYNGHRATLLPLKTADTILCIAGGIGITSCMSFLQQYAHESQSVKSTSGALMHNASISEEALIRHVSASLLPDASAGFPNRQIEYKFWCTGENSSQDKGLEQGGDLQRCRMNVEEVVRSVTEKGRRVVVVACAPGKMSDEVRTAVVGCLRDGMPVDLIEEAFAW